MYFSEAALHCHPATPAAAPVRALQWQIGLRLMPQGLQLHYRLAGDLAAVSLPPASAAPCARDGLWQHTCFEAFVGDAHSPAYREFNFSPSGDWAVYAFAAERQRAELHPESQPQPAWPAPQLRWTRTAHTLQLQALLPLQCLPASAAQDWEIGLSAVIESADGSLSYWAIAHPREVPDFHHRASRTLRLNRSETF